MNKAKPTPQTNAAKELLDRIEQGRIIAIVRGNYAAHIERIAQAFIEAGITALEVTMNSPAALEVIKRVSSYCERRLLIGAGTVMNVQQVRAAAAAGARFIVSPNRNLRVIRKTKELAMLSFPGALTCSEIVEAFDAGADAAKLFPAQMVAPSVLRALRAPLGDVRLIPTGGVSHEDIPGYLEAGAWAFGIGSELVNPAVQSDLGLENLLKRARQFSAAIRKGTQT